MPFIGQEPQIGAYHVLDSITASATATYNLQLNGGAFSPASANHLLVSLNGVLQKNKPLHSTYLVHRLHSQVH